jgi:hypothetical protein
VPSNYGQQPVELLSNLVTMNVTDDSTSLKEGEAQLLENIVRDNGTLTVREGMIKVNSLSALNAVPSGFGTFKPLDSSTMNYATVESGTMYSGATFPLSSVLTGMTVNAATSSPFKMLPYKGKMLVNDASKGLAWTDGATGGWAGCASPKVSKLIEGFETITGWATTGGSGTVSVTQLNVTQGRNSVKFKADSGVIFTLFKAITSVVLTSFDAAPIGDGTTSTVNDYIALRLVRSAKADFDSCILYLYTNVGYTDSFAITLSNIQEWISNPASGASFDFYIRKSAFTGTAGAAWNTITGLGLLIDATTGCAPYVIMDNLRLEKSGPIARPMCKVIGDMESNETWVQGVGTVSPDTTYKKTLARSLKIDGAGAWGYRTFGTIAAPTLDLTKFDTGVDSDSMDSIELYVARDTAKIAGTLMIRFYYSAADNYYYDIATTLLKGPKITPTLYKKLDDVGKCFTLISIRKDQFTDSLGGVVDWTNKINTITLYGSTAGAYYVDSIRLVKTRDKKTVVQFEPPTIATTEAVTVTNYTSYEWADERDELKMIRTDEGSKTDLHVKMAKNTTCTIEIVLSAAINCSTFDGGGAVQDQDLLGPYFWFADSKHIKNIDILYDVSGGTYANYYIKSIPADAIPRTQKDWFSARTGINEHLLVGAGTWATVGRVKIEVTTDSSGGANFYVDQLIITRTDAISGTVSYRVQYQNSRGARSEYSNISNVLEIKSTDVLLTGLPTSTGYTRLIERFTSMGNVWERVGVVDDDDTTTFLDNVISPTIGQTGLTKTYSKPMIAKTFCIFKDVVVLGNLTGADGNTYSSDVSISKEYSFDEFDPLDIFSLGKDDGYKLLALVPALDRVYGFKEKGIYSFDPYNLNQTPVLLSSEFGRGGEHAWAVVDKGIAFLTQNKELYLTDGSSFTNLGKLQLGDVQYYLDAIPEAYMTKVQMAYYEQALLVAIPYGDVHNNKVLRFYFPTQTWTVFTGWETGIFHLTNYAGSAKLYMTAQGLYIYQLFYSNDDDGTAIVGKITTADFARDFTILRQPGTLFLTAKAISSNPTIQVTPYYDCTTGTALSTYTVASSVHSRIPEKNIPPAPSWATYLGLKFVLTGRLSVRGAAYTVQEETRQ